MLNMKFLKSDYKKHSLLGCNGGLFGKVKTFWPVIYFLVASCLAYSSVLKIEVMYSSEMLSFFHCAKRYITEDNILQ
jgi:hypothetical protein